MVGHPPQVVKQVYVVQTVRTQVVILGRFDLRMAYLAGFFVGDGVLLEFGCHASSSVTR
jgi:hypothetical protein